MNNLNNQQQVAPVKKGFLLSTGLFVAVLDGSAAVIQYLVNGGKHPWNIQAIQKGNQTRINTDLHPNGTTREDMVIQQSG